MNKTRIDDMLIEMITPKLKEIEEKFARGEGLKQEDINTLLLKSQYNHINHLDEKLNEVTSSVIGLEANFTLLKTDMEAKFELLKTDMEAKFDLLKSDIETTIQKALNRNMMLLVVVLGGFMALFKVIDKVL